ncbi:MAG: sodium/glutamate symporter, partial [Planctomycetes bacterium]|nr:sodium/glutamate symporter [Planctomycetota bacterium]
GLANAQAVGIAFATFGLIAGGLLGGPISGWLIKRHGLQDGGTGSQVTESAVETPATSAFDLTDILGTILGLAICVGAGAVINRYLFSQGVLVPGFLTALVVGIILTNLGDTVKVQLNKHALEMIGDVALYLFLTMSLMSMDLTSLSEAAGPIVSALFVQILLITVFTVFVVFRILGRDYDAAVICGGFVGLGLGATPVAIANMQATTKKFRPSPKAFLVVPLVGAFFIDITNALVIKFFIALPIFNQPPG